MLPTSTTKRTATDWPPDIITLFLQQTNLS